MLSNYISFLLQTTLLTVVALVREKIIRIADARGIDHRSLMRMFDTESILSENDSSQSSSKTDSDTSKTSTSKEDKQPLLTPKDFKNRLLQLGFKISDITTEGPGK